MKAVERHAGRLGLGCVSSKGPLETVNQRACKEQHFRKLSQSAAVCKVARAPGSREGSSGTKISDRKPQGAGGEESWARRRN